MYSEPSVASAARVGRYCVGWPGTAVHVAPPSVVRNKLSRPISETPAYKVMLGLFAPPGDRPASRPGLDGPKMVNTIPSPADRSRPVNLDPDGSCGGPCGVSFVSGNDSTLDHVAAPSRLLQSPSCRVPRYRTSPSFGSTDRRSPLPRPFSFPPNLNGTLARRNVLPPSLDRKIAP